MSFIIPLNDEEQVRRHAKPIIERLSDPFDRSTHMPVTRDLSDGKRELLIRWCKRQLNL